MDSSVEKVMKLEQKLMTEPSANCIAISPNGLFLVTTGTDNRVPTELDLRNGLVVQKFPRSSTGINAMKYTLDGERIITGFNFDQIKIWNLSTGKCDATLIGHSDSVSALAISENGQTLYSGSFDSIICVWNLENNTFISACEGHYGIVYSLAITPGFIISSSNYGIVKCWSRTTGECIKTIKTSDVWVLAVASYTYTDGLSLFASGSSDKEIRLYKDDDEKKCIRTLLGHTNSVRSLAFNVDGSHLASGSEDNTIKIWDVSSGICLQTLDWVHVVGIYTIASSRDGLRLISGSRDGMICVWIKYSHV